MRARRPKRGTEIMHIRKMTAHDLGCKLEINDAFIVDSFLEFVIKDQTIRYTVQAVEPYEKSYTVELAQDGEEEDYSNYIDNPDQSVYLAFVESHPQPVGQIVLKRNWNHYAYIEDIKVDSSFRRHGVGRALIEQAKHWARGNGMPGIMLETQNNNVKACLFYESCGFIIGGIDLNLYKGINRQSGKQQCTGTG